MTVTNNIRLDPSPAFVVQFSKSKICLQSSVEDTAVRKNEMLLLIASYCRLNITVASHSETNLISIFFNEKENTAGVAPPSRHKSELLAEALITAAQWKLDRFFF